jgi:cytochrome c5
MSEENEMTDAQFGKIFATMIGGLVALTIVLLILAYIMGGTLSSAESDVQTQQRDAEIAGRIKPVGNIKIGQPAEVAAAATPAEQASSGPPAAAAETPSGESVYSSSCVACHGAGVAGAPKIGDAGAWQARIGQGKDTLYEHAINGFQGQAGFMPAKGGNASLSDDAVKAAVDHMVQSSQ